MNAYQEICKLKDNLKQSSNREDLAVASILATLAGSIADNSIFDMRDITTEFSKYRLSVIGEIQRQIGERK